LVEPIEGYKLKFGSQKGLGRYDIWYL